MLLDIEHRGMDATGAAWFTVGGNVHINKAPAKASVFTVKHLAVPRKARTVILHTRFGTKGSEKNNLNNHPIRSGSTVGVHNGWVNTDDDMFREMPNVKRQAQVDSEAIFAALDSGHELHEDKLTRLEFVYGNMAIAWLEDGKPGVMHLAKGEGSPLFLMQTAGGSIFFASTWETLANIVKDFDVECVWESEAKPGSYYLVEQGSITATDWFVPADKAWDIYTSTYRYTPRSQQTATYWWENHGRSTVVTNTAPTQPTYDMERSGLRVYQSGTPVKVGLHGEDADYLDRRLFSVNAKHCWDQEDWYDSYANREDNIANNDQWTPRHNWLSGLYPGDVVEVSNVFDGQDRQMEVVSLPSQFPYGKVILRFTAPTGIVGRTPDVFLVEKWLHDIHPVGRKYPENSRPSWLDVKDAVKELTTGDDDESDLSDELIAFLGDKRNVGKSYVPSGKNGTQLRLIEGSNGVVVATSDTKKGGELVAIDN